MLNEVFRFRDVPHKPRDAYVICRTALLGWTQSVPVIASATCAWDAMVMACNRFHASMLPIANVCHLRREPTWTKSIQNPIVVNILSEHLTRRPFYMGLVNG